MIKHESPTTTASTSPVPTLLLKISQPQGDRGYLRALEPQNTKLPWCASTISFREALLTFSETQNHDLLSLQWPSAPRNILLVKKHDAPAATAALIEFAQHAPHLHCHAETTNIHVQARSRNLSLYLLYSRARRRRFSTCPASLSSLHSTSNLPRRSFTHIPAIRQSRSDSHLRRRWDHPSCRVAFLYLHPCPANPGLQHGHPRVSG